MVGARAEDRGQRRRLQSADQSLEPPPPAWHLEAQSPASLTVQGMITITCGGQSHLLSPLPTCPSQCPWGALGMTPGTPPQCPRNTPSAALPLRNASPGTPGEVPPPQNTPRPPREPLAQPLTSLALALSVACPIPAGWGSWCHGGRWDEAPEIKPHSGSDSHGPCCHHWLLRGGLWGGWGLVT